VAGAKQTRVLAAGAIIAVAGVSITLLATQGGPLSVERAPQPRIEASPGTYESTKHLTGEELAAALRLEPLALPEGRITNSDPRLGPCQVTNESANQPGSIVDTGSTVYCTVGIVSSEFEAWELGIRLAGRIPSKLEEQTYLLDLRAMELYKAGDIERAKKLWHEVHELRARAD